MIVLHITSRADWEAAVSEGRYEAPSLKSEGFIHCSTAQQYVEVANRLYMDLADPVVLAIDTDLLVPEVRFEAAGAESFPHAYGPIGVEAVLDVSPMRRDENGRFEASESEFFALYGGRSLEQALAHARAWMEGFPDPWWIGGAWAIDCFVGHKTRPHADVEVVVLRPSVPSLWEHLRDVEDLRTPVGHGVLQPWRGEALPKEVHQVWARRGTQPAPTWQEFARDETMIDMLIDEGDGHRWICRKDEAISLPVDEVGARTSDGTPYVKPEIQLLYKSRARRWKDERDFDRALPLLDRSARAWLRASIEQLHGGAHPWLARL